jgi:small-conductance mechanosensitive channel
MTQEQLNETQNEQKNSTISLEVPTHEIDEFDKAIDSEKQRTQKALRAAEYNRKKYGDAKDIIGERDARIAELEEALERKNLEIAKVRRADRGARDINITENKGEKNMLSFIAERMRPSRA